MCCLCIYKQNHIQPYQYSKILTKEALETLKLRSTHHADLIVSLFILPLGIFQLCHELYLDYKFLDMNYFSALTLY